MSVPAREDLPSTLRRSDTDAQETWIKTHDSAVETYGEGQRAHRVAYASLKHKYEKVGDHWERKSAYGPSDPRAARGYPRTERAAPTKGGIDVNASREHLYELAQRFDIPGRSSMSKAELAEAVRKVNDRRTAKARGDRRRR